MVEQTWPVPIDEQLQAEGDLLEERLESNRPAPMKLRCAFPQQEAFVYDDERLQAVFCTRRAAKSYSAGLKAFRIASKYDKCSVLICGLSRLEIKRIYWTPILDRINDEHGFLAKPNLTELHWTLPNGSTIYLLGMDANEKEKKKALGQKFPLVIIDESQDFTTDLRALVWDVLRPATADYGGAICLLGTPGLLARGLFFDVTRGIDLGWKLHEWTTHDNVAPSPDDPGVTCAQRWAQEIADLKAKKPGVELTPSFRRQYLREWVIDEDALVYRYIAGRNTFTALPVYPRGEWHHVLATDLGYNDATSFTVCAYHDLDPTLYLLESSKETGMDLTAVAIRAKALNRKYDFDAMVIDGANKQAVEEMRRRHDVPWRAADKTGKSDFIELMNGEFIVGRIKLGPDCGPLAAEYANLIWDDKKADKGKREEHAACENHCTDGALYGWRFCYQYLNQIPVPPPTPGSPEAIQADEDETERAAEAMARRQAGADEDELQAWSQ